MIKTEDQAQKIQTARQATGRRGVASAVRRYYRRRRKQVPDLPRNRDRAENEESQR
ncbi:MAG: hypothetical protein PVJ64_00390 [Gemmatimonadales bacterium]|jgi:hypothetical protein